jgi:hypothetical protein
MAHQRQLIREAVKAQLLGKTAALARVFETRVVPFKNLELPAVSVYILSEAVDAASKLTAPRELTRTAQVAIEAAVKQGANADDAMDSIAMEIERALDADWTFGGTASDSILLSTDLETDDRGDMLVGLVRLTYAVTYFTDCPSAADVSLPTPFAKAHVQFDLEASVNPANRAVDDIVVPTT